MLSSDFSLWLNPQHVKDGRYHCHGENGNVARGSDLHWAQKSAAGLLKHSSIRGQGLRRCISDKLPGNVGAAGLGTTGWEALANKKEKKKNPPIE